MPTDTEYSKLDYRNKVSFEIQKAKANYYEKKFASVAGNKNINGI